MRRRVGVVAAVAVAALLAGCAVFDRSENTGGMGLPQQREGKRFPGERRDVTGRFEVADNGCFLLRSDGASRLIVWPADASHGGPEAILGDGTAVADGDRLQGTGTLMPVERLEHWPDGYWGQTVGFCTPDAADVVVFDAVEIAP